MDFGLRLFGIMHCKGVLQAQDLSKCFDIVSIQLVYILLGNSFQN